MNRYGTILIVDDNPSILTALRYCLDATFERILTLDRPDDILKTMAQEDITLDEVEAEHIRRTIDHCHGNLSKAAELLGITRQTLYNKMKRLS